MANRVSYISQNLAGLGKILGDCKRFTVIFQNSVTDQHDDRVKSRGATAKNKFKILLKWSTGVYFVQEFNNLPEFYCGFGQ